MVKNFADGIKRAVINARQCGRQALHLNNFASYLFIVGAQKAGTSALYSYIGKHPGLVCGDSKELGYFSRDILFAKGDNYYRSLFPLRSQYSCALDATPEYLYYGQCAGRIHVFSPEAKIVVLLREPVSRAFSAFNMYQQICSQDWFKRRLKFANKDARDFFLPIVERKINLDLGYFLEQELMIMAVNSGAHEPSLIRRGVYTLQLERYIHLFGRQNVLVIFSNELKADTSHVVNRVLEFAGITPSSNSEYPPTHVREYTDDQGGKELIAKFANEFFAPDKAALFENYGLNVPW